MPDPVIAPDQRRNVVNDPGRDPQHGESRDSDVKKQADGQAGDQVARRLAGGAAPEALKAKDGAVLTADSESKLGHLAKGTFVEVVSVAGGTAKVKVWSGHSGEQAELPTASLKAEPLLGMNDDRPGERDNYNYTEVTSVLWGPAGPKADDVAQGYLGDCYFVAAMGAVAAANPGKVKAAFSPSTPNQKSYTVTLYGRDRAGKLQPKSFNVDTHLPTTQGGGVAYSGNGKDFSSHLAPLWPSLLEKAYAMMLRGGYAKVGDGGNSDVAMEVLTGVDSNDEGASLALPGPKLLQKFRQLQAAGTAATCGTVAGLPLKGQGGFTGQGSGPFEAQLKDAQGGNADLVEGSVVVRDQKGRAKPARDDSEGKLEGSGVAAGKVEYRKGRVDLSYEAKKGPAEAGDLVADFLWEGEISPEYHLYGNHEYIFESVQGDKVVFKNPWGCEHPQPVPVDQVKKLFDVMSSNSTGKQKKPPQK